VGKVHEGQYARFTDDNDISGTMLLDNATTRHGSISALDIPQVLSKAVANIPRVHLLMQAVITKIAK
jgi:hypothetical protein